MSLAQETQVLIVGAGPTGLACALTLATLGVDVSIVDSSATNPNGSRAAVVHTHTLEVLDTIGIAKPLLEYGGIACSTMIRGGTNILLEPDFSQLSDATEFPYALMIPQDELERVLREQLANKGIRLFRNKAVVGLREGNVGAEVLFEDGSLIRTQYVVGADGSRSTIRRLSGIEFKDPHTGVAYDDPTVPPSYNMVLADVHLENIPEAVPQDRPSFYLDKFLLTAPLRSHTPDGKASMHWRIGYGISNDESKPPRHPTIEYIQQQMDERNPWPVRITVSSVLTCSSYRVREAVAGTYFQKLGNDNVLLAGDAAHVHSPAGGQGMNLGVCDAVALARAIHSHMEAKDLEMRDAILQHYADSRRKIGIRVIGMTGGLTNLIRANKGWRRIVRNIVLGIAYYLPFVNKRVVWDISGLVNREG